MKKKDFKSGTVTITVNYGYDIHSMQISERTYRRIVAGSIVDVKGQGFHWEGEFDQDHWLFNKDHPGSLYICTDGGGEVFTGDIAPGDVSIRKGGKDLKSM